MAFPKFFNRCHKDPQLEQLIGHTVRILDLSRNYPGVERDGILYYGSYNRPYILILSDGSIYHYYKSHIKILKDLGVK